jgi:precorrin-6A/cobalt-precorrin-6A reductase
MAALVDATHPFAARMARNAARAARAAGVPRLKLWRPAWAPAPGDRWLEAADVAEAGRLAATVGRRPLVGLGGRGLAGFDFAPFERAFVRAIEAPPHLPANAEWLEARGPFAVADERRLFAERGIDVVVTKNAGGEGAKAKLAAARELRLPVVVIRRPPPPAGPLAASVEAAVAWLDQVLASRQT